MWSLNFTRNMKTYKLYLIITEEDDNGSCEDLDPVMVDEFDTEQEARLFRAELFDASADIVPPSDWGYDK